MSIVALDAINISTNSATRKSLAIAIGSGQNSNIKLILRLIVYKLILYNKER